MSDKLHAVETIFAELRQRIEAKDPAFAGQHLQFCWRVQGAGGGVWLIDTETTPPLRKVPVESRRIFDCEFSCTSDDFLKLAEGTTTLQDAFLRGSLKMAGQSAAALKAGLVLQTWMANRNTGNDQYIAGRRAE